MHRFDNAAESFFADDFFEANRIPFGNGRLITWWPVIAIGVRPRVVVMLDELTNEIVEVLPTKGNEMGQAFLLDRLDESLLIKRILELVVEFPRFG